jgi:nucleotide-binding universal stress UspA family protein
MSEVNEQVQMAKVVVGVDGSPSSRQALRWAAQFAGATKARLEAVIAWQYPAGYGIGGAPLPIDLALEAEKCLIAAIDETFGSERPAGLSTAVKEGGAARVLLAESKDALLLVVGSRGHGGFYGLLLGSVSASVAEHAVCPVLVVHGDTKPPELTK